MLRRRALALVVASLALAACVAPSPDHPAVIAATSLSAASPLGLMPRGFSVCYSNAAWRRPRVAEQNAHFGADPRFRSYLASGDTSEARLFRTTAYLFDNRSNSSGGPTWLGLWNDPQRGRGCPNGTQLALLGWRPVRFDWPEHSDVGRLSVTPASGYQLVVFGWPLPKRLEVTSGGTTIASFDVLAPAP